LELPDVLSEALNNKAILYEWTGRPHEARGLLALAVDVAEQHRLGEQLARARVNEAFLSSMWDLPAAREQNEAAVALYRRRGDRFQESLSVGNLMSIDVLAGRWDQLEELAHELLDRDADRPGHEYVDNALVMLRAAQGVPDEALLDRLTAWADSDETELTASYWGAVALTRLAEHRPAEALQVGLPMLTTAIQALGPASDAVRESWPQILEAALTLGRHDDARQVLALLDSRPPGHVPPYLRAQLARGRALLAAREDSHDNVEAGLRVAIDAFTELGYPYWLAVTETDLAAWLIDQGRSEEAMPLLEHAIDTLTALRATPALKRAEQLAAAAARTRDPVA
jgi:tetratricopeptide (TPR) repeat protein